MWIIFGKYKILCIFEHQKKFKTIIGYNILFQDGG